MFGGKKAKELEEELLALREKQEPSAGADF